MEDRQIVTEEELAVGTDNVADDNQAEKIKVVTPFIIVSGILAVFAVIVYVISRSSVSFAEFYSRTVSQWIRTVLGIITGWFPFSLGETLL